MAGKTVAVITPEKAVKAPPTAAITPETPPKAAKVVVNAEPTETRAGMTLRRESTKGPAINAASAPNITFPGPRTFIILVMLSITGPADWAKDISADLNRSRIWGSFWANPSANFCTVSLLVSAHSWKRTIMSEITGIRLEDS